MPISEVFHGDCMEYMRTIPDKYFDLCIADPPYGINAAKMNMGNTKHKPIANRQWTKKGWDTTIPHDDVFREILRVAKHAIIWGGNYFPLPLTNAWIVWDKGYDGRLSFSDGEMAWTNMPINMRIHRIIRQNTLDYDGIRIHPTQKPVALYAWLLDNYGVGGVKSSTPSLAVRHHASQRTRKDSTSTDASWTMTTTRRRRHASNASATA